MDVVRLGPLDDTSYLPDELIEGYDSMIWTERFQEAGEFKLDTYRISETMALLPENTRLSILQSEEVMLVESHAITRDQKGNYKLTVSGRSAESFLENRHVEGPYGKRRKLTKNYSPRGAAGLLIWNAIDNNSDHDVTRDGSYPVPGRDQIPNVMITDSVGTEGESKRWWVNEGPLYPQLMNILIRYDMGLRTIRPSGTSGTRVKVLTAPTVRGNIERDYVTDISALRFHLFNGVDRSRNQRDNEKVIFNTKHDHVDNPQYLFSIKDSKTACEVMSEAGGGEIFRNDTQKAYKGWDRRVMSWDAGSPEYPEDATKAEKNAINDEFREDADKEALRALRKQRKTRLFTGDISPNAPYVYKTHYDLGDTVTLHGEYGQFEEMIVNEYVRTEDASGERGYPGLAEP